jgi:hypothetical protein
MTGSIFGNTCFSSVDLAVDAYFQAVVPVTLASGDLISFQKITNVWNRVQVTPANVSTATIAPTPTFSDCDPQEGFSDGATVAGILVSSVFIVVALMMLSRAK